MDKKINWSKIIEWTIIAVVVIAVNVISIEYLKTISTFQALVTFFGFIAGVALGAVFMKWYVKYVKKLPW